MASVREVKRAKFKEANLVLETHMREAGFGFLPEHKFYEGRDWRADYLINTRYDQLLERGDVLVEIEGGVWKQGRHTRGSGYVNDLQKYNMASALGFKLFRFTTEEVLNGTAKAFLEKWA
jgi:very-short-patch-repair endonuclease